MEDKELLEVIKKVRLEKVNNFNKLKRRTNTDEGLEMIVLDVANISVRKVNDWGRDEDVDCYLGLDDEGWITYTQTNHNLAGPFKIIDEKIIKVSDEYVLNYIKEKEDARIKLLNMVRK